MTTVGHDGGKGNRGANKEKMDARLQLVGMTAGVSLVWGALGTDPSPPAQDDNLDPMTTVGHDGEEEDGDDG